MKYMKHMKSQTAVSLPVVYFPARSFPPKVNKMLTSVYNNASNANDD